jgi:uncharacterized protein YyaL (SSP411 family)
LKAAWAVIEKYPHAHISLLNALEELLHPPQIVILRGETADIESWQSELSRIYSPHRVVLAIPAEAHGLPPALADKPTRGKAVAYVCEGSVCSAPLESFSALADRLRQAASPRSS